MTQIQTNFSSIIDADPAPHAPAQNNQNQGGENTLSREKIDKLGIDTTTERLYAAIDLGTNKCRLLIARQSSAYAATALDATENIFSQNFQNPIAQNRLEVVESFSSTVWLGDGMSEDNYLHDFAIERALTALRICAEKLSFYQPFALRAVATAACRNARNADDFRERVASETGLEIEIISAEQEAMLALQGCSSLIDQKEPFALLFDIGGGSTEILWLERQGDTQTHVDSVTMPQNIERRGFISLPLGVSNLMTHCRNHGFDLDTRYTMKCFNQMRDTVIDLLQEFEQNQQICDHIEQYGVQMLGCSSTVTTIIAKHLELKRYDRSRVDGQFITRVALQNEITDILQEISESQSYSPLFSRHKRRDFVLAGCAIITAIIDIWPVERLRVADRGVREGILLGLMGQS